MCVRGRVGGWREREREEKKANEAMLTINELGERYMCVCLYYSCILLYV